MEDKRVSKQEYLLSLNKVVEYINNNLDKKISIPELAEISNFSEFHFHRITKALLGEPIGKYITRIRVETAARLIRYTKLDIQDIAYSVGYETPTSLNKVFKQFYAISPSEYRNDKDHVIIRNAIKDIDIKLKNPKIVELPERNVIYINIKGEYGNETYQTSWNKLWEFVKNNNLFTKGIESIGLGYDDPSVTEDEHCRYDACLTIHKPIKAQGEIGTKKIDGGKFAVFLYEGSYAYLGEVYDTIFGKWLINSEYEVRSVPVMEKYLNNPNRTAPEKYKTAIYLPIK